MVTFENSDNSACFKALSVDITDGVKNNRKITKDGIVYNSSNYHFENGLIYGCPCNFKKCIRKCCGLDEIMIDRVCTKSDIIVNIPIYQKTDLIYHIDIRNSTNKLDYFYIYKRCKNGTRLSPDLYPETDSFFVQEDGKFFAPDAQIGVLLGVERYCVDIFNDAEIGTKFAALFCSDEDSTGRKGIFITIDEAVTQRINKAGGLFIQLNSIGNHHTSNLPSQRRVCPSVRVPDMESNKKSHPETENLYLLLSEKNPKDQMARKDIKHRLMEDMQ
ncbi:hypothetical protein HHI36_020597 [Cryptolaemus montrouzieri]|uniref:Methuselah N-terminal domain-containing protein n=1 Tax=Cryptolaemus montrouzieri TaxID=559131 RepID=A0ABD2NAS5_9CUCU